MKLFLQYVAIFFIFSSTSSHLHLLVVNEDDNGKLRLERVKDATGQHLTLTAHPSTVRVKNISNGRRPMT